MKTKLFLTSSVKGSYGGAALTNRILETDKFKNFHVINLKNKYGICSLLKRLILGYMYAFKSSGFSLAIFTLHPYGALEIKSIVEFIELNDVNEVCIDNTLYSSVGRTLLSVLAKTSRLFKNKSLKLSIVAHNIEHHFLLSRIQKAEFRFIPLYVYSIISDNLNLGSYREIYCFTERDCHYHSKYSKVKKIPINYLMHSPEQPSVSELNTNYFHKPYRSIRRLRLLIFGSPNVSNIANLKLCYKLSKKYKFIDFYVAGGLSNTQEAILLSSYPAFTLLGSYDRLSDLGGYVDFAFVPDITGAGIKMRILDAIENQIPVIATPEASIGYEMFINCSDSRLNIIHSFEELVEYVHVNKKI